MKALVAPARRSPRFMACVIGSFVFLRLRVEFDPHGIGIDITKKNLNVK